MTTTTSEPAPLDLVPVDADWVSVTGRSCGVARVRTRRVGRALLVRAAGGGEPRPGDWGAVAADGVFSMGPGGGYAFTASFDGGATASVLQTHQKHGVMAIHAYHRFADGSGRRDYYTREFYVPASGDSPQAAGRFPAALLDGANDPDKLAGTWTVLDRESARITTLSCVPAGGALAVRARGADGRDWGTAPAHLYADAADPDGPPSFLAAFYLDDRRIDLQGRYYLGVLVAAQYTAYTDGGDRTDFWTRDVFRR